MKRITLFIFCFLAAGLSMNAGAKILYENGFDNLDNPITLNADNILANTLHAFPYPIDFATTYLSPKGGCFRRSAGHPFDTWTYSTRYIFSGKTSWRTEVQTNYPNPKGKCQFAWVQAERKSREELSIGKQVAGSGVSDPPWGEQEHGDPAMWYSFALFIPGDEGTPLWWAENTIILQHMGGGNSSTPEIHWILQNDGGQPRINVALMTSANADREVIERTDWKINLKKDTWHTFLEYWVRDWDSDGRYKLWVDCENWADSSCKPVIDRVGKTSIRDKPKGSFSLGLYDSHVDTGKTKALYWDALRVSDASSTFKEAASNLIVGDTPALPSAKPEPPTWGTNKPIEETNRLELNWINPIARVDGTALDSLEIKQTEIYYTCGGKNGSSTVTGSTSTFSAGLPGDETCIYTLATTDTSGLISSRSDSYTYPPEDSGRFPIEEIDTTYFQGWIMVLSALQLIILLFILLLMVKVYRKFYDDLPDTLPEPVDTDDTK